MTDPVEQLRHGIHNYFREFGYNACDLIFNELIRHGGMNSMLLALGLDDPGNSDDQYVYLLNFLRRNGIDAFARRLGTQAWFAETQTAAAKVEEQQEPKRTPEQPALVKAEEELPHVKQHTPVKAPQYHKIKAGVGRRRTSSPGFRKLGTAELERMRTSPPLPEDREPVTPSQPEEPAHQRAPFEARQAPSTGNNGPEEALAPAPAAPAPVPVPDPEPAEKHQGTLPDGQWDGITERRSGEERRSGRDRRADVDVVFKNKRYGGDRRSGNERRKNWPPEQWPLPRDKDGKITND